MVPVIAIVVATIIASLAVYVTMVNVETETCWDRLRIATESTALKINTRITDNLNFLDSVADSYVLTEHLELEEEVGDYLTSVMSKTIFESIDVILPDGAITQQGERIYQTGDVSYDELVKLGTHVSSRNFDKIINDDVLYCFTPIISDNETKGMLCGKIKCRTLSEIFEVFTFRGQSQIFLIDRNTGDYLIDNWHDTLGNVYDNQWRTGFNGEKVDIISDAMSGNTARIGFISNTNGDKSYQYCTPVENFNWSLCVVVQDDVVFRNLHELEQLLITVGIVEALLLIAFLAWNVWLTNSVAKSEARANELELNRATNEAKARFISNMSHDVRTPLNGIVGMLHIIKTHRDDKETVDECLQKIEISTQYLTTLTGDMLDINEIESNKLVLDNLPIDLHLLANAVTVMVEPKAKNAGVIYHADFSELKNPYVLGSAVHIQRVVVNLITNAIKYSKSHNGEVWFSIDDTVSSDGQGIYRFTVRDNGIGISEDFQKNMYNPFAQEKITARSSYQGYGLGLTIVYRLIEKMNGTIEVESKKDEGTKFIVTLPLPIDKNQSGSKQTETVTANLSGISILLVEDNEFNKEIAEVILSDVGALVTTAENGRDATEMFENSRPFTFDIILMDIMMPEMDGCEATQLIRAMNRPDAQKIPIFAMTANTFAEEIERCKQAGMNEHISKPLDINNLTNKVAKYCKASDDAFTER